MALLAVQDITTLGLTPAYTAATAGGDTFMNNGQTVLHVKNGSAASIDVTVASAITCNRGFQHDLVVAVPIGEKMIGPFPAYFTDPATGLVNVAYSASATITVAALDI